MKHLALYPFLFALYIIMIPLANNLGQLDPAQALRPLLILFLVAAAGLFLFRALFKDWQYAAYLIFLILAFFFVFGHLNRLAQDNLSFQNKDTAALVLLVVWAVILGVLGLKPVWSRLNGRVWMPPFFNLVFALALVFPGYTVLTHLRLAPRQALPASAQALPDTGETTLDCTTRPDIYYIILDAYGRQDVLNGMYGEDNQPFIDYLESKGFYVASESHSNYIQTVFSVPSALSYSFIDPPQEGVDGLKYFTNLVEDNRIMHDLKSCGYLTVAIESGFYFTEHPGTDIYLSSKDALNNFEDLLLAGSPWQVVADQLNLGPVEQSYKAHRQRVQYSFEQLGKLSKMPGPKIVFAHIISPHPPFVFDARGRPVEPHRAYSVNDGDDYKGTLAEYQAGYAKQVQFVNQKLERAIDTILAKSPTPPVIIIQGDHGPGSHLVWDSPANTCLWERTSILNAYYLPGEGKSMLYPSITPVNSFRVVLNEYFGEELPLLSDRTYFTSHRLEGQSIDITAERTSRKNCTP